MKKKLLGALLCICMVAGTTACGSEGQEGNSASGSDPAGGEQDNNAGQEENAGGESGEAGDEEPVELTYYMGEVSGRQDAEVIKYIEDKLNIRLNFVEYTPDQWAAGMASGDLPDIFQTRSSDNGVNIVDAIDAGVVLELSDLVEEYGTNIKQNIPHVLDYMRKYRSNGTGNLYGITTGVPINNPEGETVVSDYGVGFLVRWDYYKEMGYPEISSEDEFLDMVKQMQEAHPTTADGKPVYGFGGFQDWGLWSYFVPYVFQNGWMNGNKSGCLTGADSEIQPMFGEDADMFKRAMQFMNKAYRMGLCDPEMFTMKNADFVGKHANLQYLTVPCNWYDTDAKETQKEQGVAETDLGWRMIPGAFPEMYGGYPSPFGMTERPTVISKNCKNPEAAIKLLDYLASYEGSRLLVSGIEGVHWETVDGQKEYKDEVLQRRIDDPAAFRDETGIGVFGNMMGLAGNSKDEEGQFLDLGMTDRAMSAALTPADKDFSEHYGVAYPAQAYELRGNITYYNVEPTNMAKALDSDMEMISTQCDNYYLNFVAKLVTSGSEEEFEQNWTDGCAELDAMGYNEMMAAYIVNVEEAREELKGLGYE